MKTIGVLILLLSLGGLEAHSQGRVFFSNSAARTRLWSIDGPLAGPGIWGQFFVGSDADSLELFGPSVEHQAVPAGVARLQDVTEIPGIPCSTFAYVQMVAWDGRLWGTVFADVPSEQLGMTDVVSVFASCGLHPVEIPRFTRPAIVPIPEPSGLVLGISAAAMLLLLLLCRGHQAAH
jgi:hypothetical protein